MLTRGVRSALDRALIGETLLALQEELLTFAPALPAFGVCISGHFALLLEFSAIRWLG
ncbi:MAG: hypothetical protein ABIU95_08220 [Burkholderiales bacterium]